MACHATLVPTDSQEECETRPEQNVSQFLTVAHMILGTILPTTAKKEDLTALLV